MIKHKISRRGSLRSRIR